MRVRVIGEVDLQTAPMLEQALFREVDAGSEVLLDLSEVSFNRLERVARDHRGGTES